MLQLSIEYKFSKEPIRNRLEHPLIEILESVHESRSIGRAAKQLGRSYRNVWGELKHWESVLNAHLIVWGRNSKGAELTPQAIEFLLVVSKTQVDLAPQFAHIQNRFQQCITVLNNANKAQQMCS